MVNSLIRFIVTKIAGLKRRVDTRRAISFTRDNLPELSIAYSSLGKFGQSGTPRQPFKGWEIWCLLEAFKPGFIAEMGSGTTSAVFALWARRHAAKYVCYEHHPEWANITESCLKDASLVCEESPVNVVATRVSDDGKATGFVKSIPNEADFVYVDGPPCVLDNGKKVPNDDVVRLFDEGFLPATIVVDGRLETIDLIREHDVGKTYKFTPSLVYCLRRGHYFEAMTAPEHAIFVRRR